MHNGKGTDMAVIRPKQIFRSNKLIVSKDSTGWIQDEVSSGSVNFVCGSDVCFIVCGIQRIFFSLFLLHLIFFSLLCRVVKSFLIFLSWSGFQFLSLFLSWCYRYSRCMSSSSPELTMWSDDVIDYLFIIIIFQPIVCGAGHRPPLDFSKFLYLVQLQSDFLMFSLTHPSIWWVIFPSFFWQSLVSIR